MAQRWRRTIDVNLTGRFLGIRAVVNSMCRAGGGVIVNISSMTSEIAVTGLAHYTASKHAIAGLTKAAALELGDAFPVDGGILAGIMMGE